MSLDSIPVSFQSAWAATDYASSVGKDQTIDYSNISFFEPQIPASLEKIQSDLLSPIRIGKTESAIIVLNNIFSEFEVQNVSLEFVKHYFLKSTGDVLALVYSLGVPLNKDSTTIISEYILLENIPTIRLWITNFIEYVCTQILKNRDKKNLDLIDNILKYIRDNYSQDISLNQIADDVYMSVPYLSKIFKDYSHETFTEYLTTIRIDESKKLLSNTNMKISDVAQNVGYVSAQSFIRAFKKKINMTPSKYRDISISQNLFSHSNK